jgi:signal peptidase I
MTEKRGVASRVGIVLLNFVAAGLGLLRLGDWRTAAGFFSISLAILLFFNFAPFVPFAILALVGAVGIGCVVAALWLSWRKSRTRQTDLPVYSRWYSIVAAGLVALSINLVLTDTDRLRYRSFYTTAESMAPTLPKNDRLIAFMGSIGTLRRGDLVLVRAPHGDIYVKRVAALPGDRFAMRLGVVTLNGTAVPQRVVGVDRVPWAFGSEVAHKLAEQFPGEQSQHEIYDLGPSPGDEVDELIVPNDSVLVLGDNRDRSADSRFPPDMGGLGGPVPLTAIVGRPIYQSWRSSRPVGTKLFN